MAARVRMTIFSRFMIMMLFIAPLAYLGASYYNGQDGIKNIKDFFNRFTNKEASVNPSSNPNSNSNPNSSSTQEKSTVPNSEDAYELKKLKEELDYKQRRLDELYKENEDLERKLKECLAK